MKSFRARLTLQWVLVFSLVLTVSMQAVYFIVRYSLYSALEADLSLFAAAEIAAANDGVPSLPLREPPNADAAANDPNLEKLVQVIAAAGTVSAQSKRLRSGAPLVGAEVREQALAGHAVFAPVTLDGRPGHSLSLAAGRAGQRYIFVSAVPLASVYHTLNVLRRALYAVSFIALLATGLVGYRLATSALRPVDLIARRAEIIGRGDLKLRLPVPAAADELNRLTRVLNEMIARLYGLIEAHQRFAADASHELRSPITALRGRIEIALRASRTPAEYAAALTSCLAEVDRLAQLADDLLELARADAQRLHLDLSDVELASLAAAVMAQMQPRAEQRRVTVKSLIPPALTVIADERRLRRVLINLLANAVNYSQPAGGQVEITAAQTGDECRIEVRDDGVGLSEEQQGRVFERFWRADRARALGDSQTGGTGLGLSICREIIRAHGGEIEVESRLGAGSNFRLRLPVRL